MKRSKEGRKKISKKRFTLGCYLAYSTWLKHPELELRYWKHIKRISKQIPCN